MLCELNLMPVSSVCLISSSLGGQYTRRGHGSSQLIACLKGALSQHFFWFPAKNIQTSFFVTFYTWAKNTALKFRTKTSINFFQEELSLVHLWFCLKDRDNNFEKIEGKFLKGNPSPSLPSTATESNKKSQYHYLVFIKQILSLVLSFHWSKTCISTLNWGK